MSVLIVSTLENYQKKKKHTKIPNTKTGEILRMRIFEIKKQR